ncbi:hypothetical protein D5S17_22900 [Pseudonocardiaceae bacterium YIM PH 21723]|nr:hypothetical protein D5S17_22900 [Pseudonocardiaceae bacterium YIM PH 21723]
MRELSVDDVIQVKLGSRGLLVIGGPPGANRALLAAAVPGATLITPNQTWENTLHWAPSLLRYPLARVKHWLRIVKNALTVGGPIVLREPATRQITRTALRRLAWVSGRDLHLIWVDSATDEPRGRRLWLARRMLVGGATPPGWQSARVISRAKVRDGLTLRVTA